MVKIIPLLEKGSFILPRTGARPFEKFRHCTGPRIFYAALRTARHASTLAVCFHDTGLRCFGYSIEASTLHCGCLLAIIDLYYNSNLWLHA